ncbi:CLUMA_CG011981, isoform B [Clunio marinus]|uniref:CLUMA_CG011981, isoform B n=1 Tax=Clunio marinus TaxID=568069 RepID=A0A1J1IJ18_9DIPT|nr:CLUMA_CG011981, isoform B [Clunio marinus]
MDEPQLTTPINDSDINTDKNSLNENVIDEIQEASKTNPLGNSTENFSPQQNDNLSESLALPIPEEADKMITDSSEVENETVNENAGTSQDVSITDLNDVHMEQSMEQVMFEKTGPSLNETENENKSLDFDNETSINISQLVVDRQDDSNDAFNALKESETDALQTPKEEPKESDKNEASEGKDEDSSMQVDSESAFDNINNEENDITTETTNEGEGIDEDVCLLGDESVVEMDKEAGQAEEVIDDDETEGEQNSSKQQSTAEATDVNDVSQEKDDSEDVEMTEEIVEDIPQKENEIREISEDEATEQSCLNCENSTKCLYQMLEENGEMKYLCSFTCVKEHRDDNPDKYSLTHKKLFIREIFPIENVCVKCNETKSCKYLYRLTITKTITKSQETTPGDEVETSEGTSSAEPTTEKVQTTETKYLCDDSCLKEFIGENTEKYEIIALKKRPSKVQEESGQVVEQTKEKEAEEEQEVPKIVARSDAEVEAARLDRDESFRRCCAHCFKEINFTSRTAHWESFDFCDEKCLGLYQSIIAATCCQCNHVVSYSAMGKLCVRFGSDIKQFCTTQCLNDFKENHHPCSLCSKNLKTDDDSNQTFNKKGNNFCDEICAKRYDDIVNTKKRHPPYLCSVCNNKKIPRVQVLLDGSIHRFCSTPCFSAFKFVNNVSPDKCEMCTRYFERKSSESFTIYQGKDPKMFCTQACMNIFITKNREIWKCNWCKVSKYNFDMVQMNFNETRMCSLNCLTLSEVSTNALSRKSSTCDQCKLQKQPQYHLTMTDSSFRNFCTYQCALGFQSQFTKNRIAGETPEVVPTGTAKRIKPASQTSQKSKQPVISLVQSLNIRHGGRQYSSGSGRTSGSPIPVPELTVQLERLSDVPTRVKISSLQSLTGGTSSSWRPISPASSPTPVEYKTQVVTVPALPKQVGNKSTMCKALTLNKAINCVPMTSEAECQTEDWLEQRMFVPIPIPIFVPQPMYMYNLPTPIPVPFPLPIPVPIFVPTTRNSSNGIMKEIKKIQEKMPTDPYEAELLMMAEMVAGDKKREETDSDSDENNEIEYGDGIENNSSFNEDLVQMAFKMASGNDFDDPPVDLENEMTANTISQSSNAYDEMDPISLQHHHQLMLLQQQQREATGSMQSNRGRKRIQTQVKQTNSRAPSKRIKREMEVIQPEMPREPAEKPDANMCLKYTFGVNAWKQWVATKNADFEKSSIRRKPIKSEILQLTADELNYSLCMFVKEVRKPNGSEYAPDTIYYLVLGIQQYLYENGRIDNIFTDRYYEQFTDCLDEVAKKFSVLYNDSQYIVTRVEEEHLWECKQLGAHSPHVLLSTLMFFNTKHFNLVTVDEHMELSFSHIMKHWKRNPNQPGAAKVPGSRNVLLRFYPPQSSLDANSRKKKVYEQQENEENPLRCPVKLYEFYFPESVKTRNDVFYLQPERSCVPDSPVWYSTQPLSREALSKMLHRVKMVKEINIALLTS